MKTKSIAIAAFLFSSALFAADNTTILYVGDSHSYGQLGVVVEKNLSKVADHVIMESSCGSTPSTWLGKNGYAKTVCGFWKKDGETEERSVKHETPKFTEELAKYHPQYTIVQLGTNIAAGDKPQNYTASTEAMMQAIQAESSECIWIGPPDANSKVVTRKKLKITNAMLIELAKKYNCHYIDSLVLTSFPASSKEGIHYPPSLSAAWGEKVSAEILKIIADKE